MRNILIALAIAAFGAAPVAAQTNPEECAAISEDGQRLACYDGLFRNGTSDAPIEPIVLSSERMIPALPTGRQPATMVISCDNGSVGVAFGFAGQFVSSTGDIAPITLQVDQNATAVRTLVADDANTALVFSSAPEAEAFLNGLAGGRNLKVRMTPVRQRSLTVDFRLGDALDEIAALRSNCR